MTDKPHCPVCDEKLETHCLYKTCMVCGNPCCRMYNRRLDPFLLNLLVDGKKAQDALKEATKCINWTIDTIYKGLDREADIVGCCELTLERINKITKGENKDGI